MTVLLLFFCSGATALVYEVIWSKYLSLMFGSTVQAQTVVLAVFMGGLALGNRLIGKRSDLLLQPLAAYGYLEVAIGVYAFAFPWLYQAADQLFISAGAQMFQHGRLLLTFKGILSIALLLLPTVLMGGTLPLLAAWLQHRVKDAGRLSARFYSLNSLGAVCGSGIAGFYLVRHWGLVASLQLTALANLLIGLIAIALARRESLLLLSPNDPAAKLHDDPPRSAASLQWGVLLVALTGGVSMGLEVLASRSLALIFGSSLQAFAIVLMAFILGIGLGSAVIASPRLQRWQDETTIIGLLLGGAITVGLLVLGIEQWVDIYRHLQTGLARTEMGYTFHQAVAAGLALVVLGLPAALLGAVLPVCIRAEGSRGLALGERVGRLLTWNTIGAVAGVLITGFVLMPAFGLRAAFAVLATLLCLATALLAARTRHPLGSLAALLTAAGLIAAYALTGEGWRHVLSSGVFRARETVVNPETMEHRRKHIKILFYEDAADATVTVEEGDGIGAPADRGLRINGKPDASTRGDVSTQMLVAHLPMLSRPEAREVFLLGLGSGMSAGALLAHPVSSVTIAENCEPVVRAGHLFAAWNRGVLTNALVRLLNEDARTILKLSPKLYDVIICQPSNPWMVGVGSVFSREFYQLTASRLKPGGLMVQWFHSYENHDGIVNLVLRTFASVFPHMEIWDTGSGDLVLLGAPQPWTSSPDTFRVAYQRPEVAKDLAGIGFPTPEILWSRQFASQLTAPAIPGPGPVQSDGFPILEYEAPKAFYLGVGAQQLLRFDERTWQSDLAPAAKREVLRALGDADLQSSFTQSTINDELRRYVIGRLLRTRNGFAQVTMPSLFQPPDVEWTLPDDPGSDLNRALREAVVQLHNEPDAWADAVATLRAGLAAVAATPGAQVSPSAGYYAATAARVYLRENQPAEAAAVIELGLRSNPLDPELAYLLRVLERRHATP